MKSDKEIAINSINTQKNARDYRLCDLPNYAEWSKKKESQGFPVEIMMELDTNCMFLLPEKINEIDNNCFDEFLMDLLEEMGEEELIRKLENLL